MTSLVLIGLNKVHLCSFTLEGIKLTELWAIFQVLTNDCRNDYLVKHIWIANPLCCCVGWHFTCSIGNPCHRSIQFFRKKTDPFVVVDVVSSLIWSSAVGLLLANGTPLHRTGHSLQSTWDLIDLHSTLFSAFCLEFPIRKAINGNYSMRHYGVCILNGYTGDLFARSIVLVFFLRTLPK